MLGLDAERSRKMRIDLHDQQSIRIGRGTVQFVDARSGVQRQRHAPAFVGRGRNCRDDARSELSHRRRVTAEIGGHEVDAKAAITKGALDGPEKSRQHTNSGLEENGIRRQQQRGKDCEVFEFVGGERLQKRTGLTWPERNTDDVARPDQRRGLARRAQPALIRRFHRLLVPVP